MDRFALISDLHGNLAAVEAVLADIAAQGITEVVCLGDIVGYGPDPLACADLVFDRCRVVVRGNHDEALLEGALGFHAKAREAIDWTRDQLRPGFFSGTNVRRRWERLTQLPARHDEPPYTFVHGSPNDPTAEYVIGSEVASWPEKYLSMFERFDRYLFCGHTHLPCVVTEDLTVRSGSELADGFTLGPGKVIVNVGSVGQPRDKDPRACYVVVEGGGVTWRRVAYDVNRTLARFKDVEKLHPSLGERLVVGA